MTGTTPKHPNVKVKLTGSDGNAFNVLGLCSRAARKAKLSIEEITAFRAEATAGDYNNLLATCARWFDVS